MVTDFNQYFQQPMIAHPTLSAAALDAEVQAGIRAMWRWPNVIRRLAGGVLASGAPA
jgi:hypothetical protein